MTHRKGDLHEKVRSGDAKTVKSAHARECVEKTSEVLERNMMVGRGDSLFHGVKQPDYNLKKGGLGNEYARKSKRGL